MHIEFTLSPTEEDIASIYQGLLAFDAPHFPGIDVKNFGLFVRDSDNQVVGGLSGDLLFTSLLIQYFWISEPCRAQGLGRTLIERAEQEAKARGALNIYLSTFTFQAPEFYQHAGFVEVGRYIDYPHAGIDKIFYQKRLNQCS